MALAAQRQSDRANLTLDGRWIAQLAGKYDGVTDLTQTAANGSHTFHHTDILAEHESLRTTFEANGASVYLLQATDFGRQRPSGRTIWVTVADAGLYSADDTSRWCSRMFPNLTKKQVTNVCLPRQLQQPY
ncbi:MAG: hypothetical protein QM695_07060 [Micropruina sp.]